MYVEKFKHPIHAFRYAQAIVKRTIADMRPKSIMDVPVPQLFKSLDYYFTFEMQPRQEYNCVFWGLCCFTCDGEIIFARKGRFDVSLWRFRRQGVARTATIIEGTIRIAFNNARVPLDAEFPFSRDENGIYKANICWWKYEHYLRR